MKREILIPLLILILGLLFIIINIVIFCSKGNSWLISKKLKIGAMILSLTGIIACGSPPKVSCYEQPPSKDYIDSIANARKQDSIKTAKEQKQITDSIANAQEEQKKIDSLAKIKHKKKPPVIKPTCYKPVQKTCYAPVKKQPE